MASRLLERYKAEIKPVLEAEFSKNKTLTAKIDKVVISVGAGEAMKDTKLLLKNLLLDLKLEKVCQLVLKLL